MSKTLGDLSFQNAILDARQSIKCRQATVQDALRDC